jgi:hypothetical protein
MESVELDNNIEGGNGSATARSFTVVKRQDLIEKMEQLKNKFQIGIQLT